jgi:hypothetical protein
VTVGGTGYLGLSALISYTGEYVLEHLVKEINTTLKGIEWISPIRKSLGTAQASEQTSLDAEAANLIGILFTLYNNDRAKFEIIIDEL